MREQILLGDLPLPGYDKFDEHEEFNEVLGTLQSMWHSMWKHYCANKSSTSTVYWTKQAGAGNTAMFLHGIKILFNSGWIELKTTENYSSVAIKETKLLEFCSSIELEQIRLEVRMARYLPLVDTTDQHGLAAVYANGKRTDRKLSRPGMQIGAKSVFQLDRDALLENYEEILPEVTKGMDKVFLEWPDLKSDGANYSEVSEEVLKYLALEDHEFNMGVNNCDSRGRAIKSGLSKVMNPIGFKVARCLLVIPE
jgi:hypothetical protein